MDNIRLKSILNDYKIGLVGIDKTAELIIELNKAKGKKCNTCEKEGKGCSFCFNYSLWEKK